MSSKNRVFSLRIGFEKKKKNPVFISVESTNNFLNNELMSFARKITNFDLFFYGKDILRHIDTNIVVNNFIMTIRVAIDRIETED